MSSVFPGETGVEDFNAYACPADGRIDGSSEGHLAVTKRLSALNIGYYHEKYGDVPEDTLLSMLGADTLTEETKALLPHGMHDLVAAFGEVRGGGRGR